MNKFAKILMVGMLAAAVTVQTAALAACSNAGGGTTAADAEAVYEANKNVKYTFGAEDFHMSGCGLISLTGAKNGTAVMLNNDVGFSMNSRGYAEVTFDIPKEGWFELTVSGGSDKFTPIECYVNDYDLLMVPFNTNGYSDFTTKTFLYKFKEGENCLRFRGPGSNRAGTVDAVYVRGFNTPKNVTDAFEDAGLTIVEGTETLFESIPAIAGFGMSVATTSDKNVVAENGALNPDGKTGADKTCNIKLNVTRGEQSSKSKDITVTVPKKLDPAAQMAKAYETAHPSFTVNKNETFLRLPAVEGAEVYIREVAPEGILFPSGAVCAQKEDVTVKIKASITKANGDTALTEEIPVLIKGTGRDSDTFYSPISIGADPFVCMIDGKYYHIGVSSSGGIYSLRMWVTDSFIDFNMVTQSTTIFTFEAPSPDTWNDTVWGWFPIFKWTDGHYYIYYAADNGNNENHRCGVLRSDGTDPLGPYTNLGIVNTADCWAIGMVPFEWKGQWYVTWSGWEGKAHFPQVTYMAKMNSPADIGERVKISAPEYEWEGYGYDTPIEEGGIVYNINGKLFLLYCADASFSNRYKIGMCDYVGGDGVEDVLDPHNWVKRPEPVFGGQYNEFVQGAAVPTIVQSPDGSEYWLYYHAARYNGSGWARYICAKPITFDEEGLPVFGEPAPYYTPLNLPAGDDFHPAQYTIHRAKEFEMLGDAYIDYDRIASGGFVVRGMLKSGDGMSLKVNITEPGYYDFLVCYSLFSPSATHTLKVDGNLVRLDGGYRYPGPRDYFTTPSGNSMKLSAGEHTITLTYLDGGEAKIDFIGLKFAGKG